MSKLIRTCSDCAREKSNKHFYYTRGNKCIGCCAIEKYNLKYKPDDPSLTKEILKTKYKNKIEQLEKNLNTYKAKLEELE